MSGSQANFVTNPAVSAGGAVDNLLIERFTGIVHEQYLRTERFETQFNVQTVVGTNQVTNKNVGITEVQKLTPGQEPESKAVDFDNHSLVVDTVILARNTVAMLHDIQSDIQVQQRLASNQVKQLIKLSDETLLAQLVKGSAITSGRVTGQLGGTQVTLDSAGDELVPTALLDAIRELVQSLNEKEVDNHEMIFACPWAQFYALQDAEKITNKDYNGAEGNGGIVDGYVIKAYGVRITPTNRITTATQTSLLSNAQNGNRYNVSAVEARCVGILFGRDGLLVGRTMDVSSDIYFNKRLKTFFIDSWFSFGAIPDRYEHCGSILKAA
jgi:hypothetical protein